MSTQNINSNDYVNYLKGMMSIIIESTDEIADLVFNEYKIHKEHKGQKIIYNLFADAFLSIRSFCKLMIDGCWSQASTILRMSIEEAAALFILSYNTDSRQKYVNLYNEHYNYLLLNENDKNNYRRSNGIKTSLEDYFDYSWIKDYTPKNDYGRDQLIQLARLDEFKGDIKDFLNPFSHGSISIFQFCNEEEGWGIMEKYGHRIVLIDCKLFDFVCCSFAHYIGDDFANIKLYNSFARFREIYNNIITLKNK